MNCGVIVETRSIPLRGCVENHLRYLPNFRLIIFTSRKNRSFIASEVDGFNATIITINKDKLTEQDYNKLLTSVDFWQCLTTYEKILIFQYDSGILREGIDEFMGYDYVGAPWKFQEHGGNGGLSLRNPLIMQEICRWKKYDQRYGNEDVYFCNEMKRLKMNLAPREVCIKFSVESIFNLGTLGYHAIEKYLTKSQVQAILTQYDNHQTDKPKIHTMAEDENTTIPNH